MSQEKRQWLDFYEDGDITRLMNQRNRIVYVRLVIIDPKDDVGSEVIGVVLPIMDYEGIGYPVSEKTVKKYPQYYNRPGEWVYGINFPGTLAKWVYRNGQKVYKP